jgi:hypothetical protein
MNISVFFTLMMLGTAFGFSGCHSKVPADYSPTHARLFLESTDGRGPTKTLPKSGVVISIGTQAMITEGDIVNAEVAQVDLGRCLMLQLTPAATRDLYRLTGSNQGKRLVLTLNDVPVGARKIDAPFTEGTLFIFVEMTDAQLENLVRDLKRTSFEIQKDIQRKS